jgi:transcriptional regulator with XRE-family HTH domain
MARHNPSVRVGLGFARASQSGAGKWLDWQNTADEPVSFPGIATRTYLLPNVPIDCNITPHIEAIFSQVERESVCVIPGSVVRGRKNPDYLGFPSRLKKARKSQGASLDTTAAHLSDGKTVFLLEERRHVPRLDTVEKIAHALGLSPAFLAYGIEADASQPTAGLRCEGVASRLRETRAARGLTMRALARAAGLTDTAVRSTETGASMPSIATVEAFAIALGVSPGWLAYGLGPVELPRRRRAAASPAPSFG